MLLAINVNNTNIKFGVVDGDRIVGEWRQHTSAMRTADEHAVWLLQLMEMEGIDPKSITDAIIGSVVPQANFNLRRLCTRYFNCEAAVPGRAQRRLRHQGHGPQEAGADRICNSVGASILFPKTPVIVVDFGTATTFDVVDEEGSYCGGVIAPGINLSIEALVNADGAAAAHRGREAQAGDRHDDRRLHAFRRLLGLCRPDRGPRRAHQGRVRKTDEGDRHRRTGPRLRRLHLGDRADRARHHCARPDRDFQTPQAHDRPVERRAAVPRPGRRRRDRHEPQSLRPCRQVADGRSRHRLRRRFDARRRCHHARSRLHRGAARRSGRHRADARP